MISPLENSTIDSTKYTGGPYMEHQMSPKMEPPIHPSHTELNPLTGLYDSRGFINQAKAFIPNLPAKEYVMIAIDMAHFRLLNKF